MAPLTVRGPSCRQAATGASVAVVLLAGAATTLSAQQWRYAIAGGITTLSPLGGERAIVPPAGLESWGRLTAAQAPGWALRASVESPVRLFSLPLRFDAIYSDRSRGGNGQVIDGQRAEPAIGEHLGFLGASVLLAPPETRSIRPSLAIGAGGYTHWLAANRSMVPRLGGPTQWTSAFGVAGHVALGVDVRLTRGLWLHSEVSLLQPLVGRGQPMLPFTVGLRF